MARTLAEWTLPPAAQGALRSLARDARYYATTSVEDRRRLERNAIWRDRHRGERCFILATGPSLKTQDLRPLASETCFAVSNFFVHPDFSVIRPRYYCLAPYHLPMTEDAWCLWVRELALRLEPAGSCMVFMGLADRERLRRSRALREDQATFLRLDVTPEATRKHGIDLTRSIMEPQSVTVLALQLAISMGFAEIYLLGCDHDWILHLDEGRHFYAEHEHAANRAGYDEWFGEDVGTYCRDYVRLWDQYRILREIARRRSIRVFNATAGGMLDVFPRVGLETVVAGRGVEARGPSPHPAC